MATKLDAAVATMKESGVGSAAGQRAVLDAMTEINARLTRLEPKEAPKPVEQPKSSTAGVGRSRPGDAKNG